MARSRPVPVVPGRFKKLAGAGPAVARSCFKPVARWPGPGPGYLRRLWWRPRPFAADSILSGPGGRVPVHHLCSVAPSRSPGMDAQSLPGIWLFSKPLVRGKQHCEVGTIIRQKQEPNGCQSQLLDMKTLDVASLAAVVLERLCSRCCLPSVCFLEPF